MEQCDEEECSGQRGREVSISLKTLVVVFCVSTCLLVARIFTHTSVVGAILIHHKSSREDTVPKTSCGIGVFSERQQWRTYWNMNDIWKRSEEATPNIHGDFWKSYKKNGEV